MNFPDCFLLARRFGALVGLLLGDAAGLASESSAPTVAASVAEVTQVIHGAVGRGPSPAELSAVPRESLGVSLGEYSSNPGGDPARYESTRLAARRILAETAATVQRPEHTAVWLTEAAKRLEARAAAAGELRADERRDLLCHARLARFHADRLIAAVHYNLFRRALSLPELYAATQQERRAVEQWRALVQAAGDHPNAPGWRGELQRLEAALHELEGQCCPPSPAHLAAPLWQPAAP